MDLPVDIIHWLLALAPLATLLVLLIGLKWTAAQSGAVGFGVAVLIAATLFRADLNVLSVATGKGIWDGIFILAVVWPALLLYEVTDRARAFDVFRVGLQRYTQSRLLLLLAFGWVFASFLQSIAGFGTPIAIVAPLLVGIGVKRLWAVVVPLIGHSWANMFGTLAVGWLATLRVIDLQNVTETAVATAALLWIPNLISGLWIAWLYGRGKAVARALPAILVISLIHGGGQLGLAFVNPIVSTFIASTVALGALVLLQRMKRYREPDPEPSPLFEAQGEVETASEDEQPYSMHLAMLPYYVLTSVALIALVIPPVNDVLSKLSVGFPFPGAETGYGLATQAETPYSPVEVLTHPGLLLLISSAIAYVVFRAKGLYDGRGGADILKGLARNALPASIAVLGFLTMSKVMDHSGMTNVLALGIAAVSPPLVYAFAANFIGVLGAFMTSSNTASNILFGPLQSETAQVAGLSQSVIVGAQSTGGAIGNAIAPANVVLGTGTAQVPGAEGDVLRKTLPYALVTAVITGLATLGLQALLG